MEEPLLTENQRYTLYPIKYPLIWNNYKTQLANFWISTEIDFSKDLYEWENRLNADERHFLKYILAFFASADGMVSVNLFEKFSREIKILEAQITYNFQCTMQAIHSEVYSIMLDTLIQNHEEREQLLDAVSSIHCIAQKTKMDPKMVKSR